MSGRRTIRHPGPVAAERHRAVSCRIEPLALTLGAGMPINDAVAQAFAGAGYRAGWADLSYIHMEKMNYVMPAASADDDHAAWYSETYHPPSGGLIRSAGLHLGLRDDEPFLHCHGTWDVPGAGRRMGHLLPFEAVLARPAAIAAYGIADAALVVRDDAETNFRLFSPERQEPTNGVGSREALLATVRPNVDICETIETICAQHGVANATVLGIGSLVGVRYSDGRDIPDHATEVRIRDGRVRLENGVQCCTLEIDMVGMSGVRTSGLLAKGHNPVCVTFELLIVADSESASSAAKR